MSSIVVEFEVLPDDSGGPVEQVCDDLRRQLADPGSVLRTGDFGRYAANATLSGPGLASGGACGSGGGLSSEQGLFPAQDEVEAAPSPAPPPRELSRPPEIVTQPYQQTGSAAGAAAAHSSHSYSHQAPHESRHHDVTRSHDAGGEVARGSGYGGSGEWQQGLSSAKVLEKNSDLERQVQSTASGGRQALEERCFQLQQRLEATERELRDTNETFRLYRARHDSSELETKLKDREQLLVHAKEMWMKENVRASKLADALTAAEDQLADQEKRLAEVAERYNEAQQEVRALQHLVGTNGGGGVGHSHSHLNVVDPYAPDKKNGRIIAASTSDLSAFGSSQALRPPASGNAFDVSFSRDMLVGSSRAIPSTAPGITMTEGGRAIPPMPLDVETNTDRFKRLCLLNDAVLYEDELLQVGIKAEYCGKEGQLAVFFGNKGSAALQAFTVQYFVKEEQALRMSASPLNQQLEANKQIVQRVSLTCQEPFVHPPWLRVQFLLPDSSPRRIQMKLPVVITKFMAGREMSAQDFFQCWRQQHFVLNEATAIVNLAMRLRQPLVQVARTIVFGGSLLMHHGIDTNPDNFVLVGQLTEQRRPAENDFDADRSRDVFGYGSDRENGLTLVRVEVGSGRFGGKARVVCRSSDHTVARALCDCLVEQLSESNAPAGDGTSAR